MMFKCFDGKFLVPLKNFQQIKLGILALLISVQLFAAAAPFNDDQVTQVRNALSPCIEYLKMNKYKTDWDAVAILAEADSWLKPNAVVPNYIENLYNSDNSYGANIQEFVARLTAGMMLGNGFKLGVVQIEIGKDIRQDEMKLYQESVIGIAQYITANKIEENSVKTNGNRSHIPAHTNTLNQLLETSSKNAYTVKINFNQQQMSDTNNQKMNQPIVNKPIFKDVDSLKDIFNENLNETIERTIFKSTDRKYTANAFLPYEGGTAEIHQNGHLWPEKYLKVYFKHSFLSSLIDIESKGIIRLLKIYAKNCNDIDDSLRKSIFKAISPDDASLKEKIFNFIKKPTSPLKVGDYFKLQEAFVKGLQKNERLLKIGTNYMEHKVREEKKKNSDETKRTDLLQDCVYTIVLKSIKIMDGILENIKNNKDANLKINEYTKEIEQFFANYSPSIEGVKESDLEVLRIEKFEDKNIKYVPYGIKNYVDNSGV